MSPLIVADIDVRPWRCEEHTRVEAMDADRRSCRLAAKMFERDGRVDQATVEEDPPVMRRRGRHIRKRHCDRAARECDGVDPGQRRIQLRTVARKLLADNPPARLLDGRKATPGQFGEQGGFASAGASRNDDISLDGSVLPFDEALLIRTGGIASCNVGRADVCW